MANNTEFDIPHNKLVDDMSPGGKTITDVNMEEFAKRGLNFCNSNDTSFEDDYDKGIRHIKVRGNKKSFIVSRVPWH